MKDRLGPYDPSLARDQSHRRGEVPLPPAPTGDSQRYESSRRHMEDSRRRYEESRRNPDEEGRRKGDGRYSKHEEDAREKYEDARKKYEEEARKKYEEEVRVKYMEEARKKYESERQKLDVEGRYSDHGKRSSDDRQRLEEKAKKSDDNYSRRSDGYGSRSRRRSREGEERRSGRSSRSPRHKSRRDKSHRDEDVKSKRYSDHSRSKIDDASEGKDYKRSSRGKEEEKLEYKRSRSSSRSNVRSLTSDKTLNDERIVRNYVDPRDSAQKSRSSEGGKEVLSSAGVVDEGLAKGRKSRWAEDVPTRDELLKTSAGNDGLRLSEENVVDKGLKRPSLEPSEGKEAKRLKLDDSQGGEPSKEELLTEKEKKKRDKKKNKKEKKEKKEKKMLHESSHNETGTEDESGKKKKKSKKEKGERKKSKGHKMDKGAEMKEMHISESLTEDQKLQESSLQKRSSSPIPERPSFLPELSKWERDDIIDSSEAPAATDIVVRESVVTVDVLRKAESALIHGGRSKVMLPRKMQYESSKQRLDQDSSVKEQGVNKSDHNSVESKEKPPMMDIFESVKGHDGSRDSQRHSTDERVKKDGKDSTEPDNKFPESNNNNSSSKAKQDVPNMSYVVNNTTVEAIKINNVDNREIKSSKSISQTISQSTMVSSDISQARSLLESSKHVLELGSTVLKDWSSSDKSREAFNEVENSIKSSSRKSSINNENLLSRHDSLQSNDNKGIDERQTVNPVTNNPDNTTSNNDSRPASEMGEILDLPERVLPRGKGKKRARADSSSSDSSSDSSDDESEEERKKKRKKAKKKKRKAAEAAAAKNGGDVVKVKSKKSKKDKENNKDRKKKKKDKKKMTAE